MKTQFVAEVSSNHHRDVDRCKQFIETAAQIGCDAVKFQLFKIDELFAPEILEKSENHRKRAQWELPKEFLPELKACCEANNIEFSCTPFYLAAVDELAPYVDFFKIASYELMWNDLLAKCAKTGLPVVISTGMATLEEVDVAVNCLRENGCEDFTLLHCVSAYPTPAEMANLATIETMRKRYNCKVGWSDHTVSPAVLNRAVHRWGATMVEFHLDLDGKGEEFGAGHCWLPDGIGNVIKDVNTGYIADGKDGKYIAEGEAKDRNWRAAPDDGLRPLHEVREQWRNKIA